MNREALLRYERERDRALVLCSAETSEALQSMDRAISALNYMLITGTGPRAQPATVNNLLDCMSEADLRRAMYVAAARTEISWEPPVKRLRR